MEYKNLIDCHSHSNFSRDSKEEFENMCKTAFEKGVKIYSVTDHCECDLFEDDGYEKSTLGSYEKGYEMKQKYNYKMKVLVGVELGQPLDNIKASEIILKRNYDFVIGSLHRAKGALDFYFVNYKSMNKSDIENMLKEYYKELLNIAKWNKFDTIAHLTYPLRYITGDNNIEVDIEKFDDIIMDIFKEVIKNDKAIEVNTSGIGKKFNRLSPNFRYIKMFNELGGKYVTIGSDSHKAYDLTNGITYGLNAIKKAGFEYVTYFEKRKPKLLKIE